METLPHLDLASAAAVVVTHNSADAIGACIEACLRTPAIAEVVVIDNASTDGTPAVVRRYPSVQLAANPDNRGFAAAVNQGVRQSSSPAVLILNPDAVVQRGVEAMLRECAEGAAAVGGMLAEAPGQPQTGFSVRRLPTAITLAFETLGLNRLWPSNPVNRAYRCLDLDLQNAFAAEQPAGAFLMFRRDAWQRIGGFDERFHPIWFEDVDFCRRLKDAGLLVRYTPRGVALHQGGHSIGKLDWEIRTVYWYASLLRYAGKYFSPVSRVVVCCCVVAGLAMRNLAPGKMKTQTGGGRALAAVVRLALRCARRGSPDVPARTL